MKNLGGHEKRKTSLLTWYDVDLTPSVYVSFNKSWSTTNENEHIQYVYIYIYIYAIARKQCKPSPAGV